MSEVTTVQLQELETFIKQKMFETELLKIPAAESSQNFWYRSMPPKLVPDSAAPLVLQLIMAELSRSAAVPVENFSEEIKQHVEMYAGVPTDHHSHLGLLRRMHAALSEPSQPSAADKPVAEIVSPVAEIKLYKEWMGEGGGVVESRDGEFIKASDLARFSGALERCETIMEDQIEMYQQEPQSETSAADLAETEQHLSELQQLKQICEGGV